MLLSVVIVNYNVKHFLEQCLASVEHAVGNNIDAEIIVVDNHSTDNSIEYLKGRFPHVKFIANKENAGFAKACNRGLREAAGRYILFLNPDTIVPEDCFEKCIAFLESHADAGALGIRMLDGSGRFLKESKRSFPSPLTSFYKLSGLAALFPKSKIFSKYHLGNLSEYQNHEVEVLAGAFMMIPKNILDQTGGFDESFFMYGEDIDLSFRIRERGYKNYFFAESSIIHFKGESTRKGGLNYVRMFYSAMSAFVSKHYGKNKAWFFNVFIQGAIWSRAVLSAIANFIRRAGLPVIDAILILLSFWLAKMAWSNFVRTDVQYNNDLIWIAFLAFTAMYMLVAYYAGLYDKLYKRSELVKSTLIATLFLLAGYSLLPEEYRFSRAMVVLGAGFAFLLISFLRWVLIRLEVLQKGDNPEAHPRTLMVASPQEYDDTMQLMKEAGFHERVIGRISADEQDTNGLGYWKRLNEIKHSVIFSEIIFCQGEISFKDIIDAIRQVSKPVTIKFHAAGTYSIVGSNSKDASGETLSKENGYRLAYPYNLRSKRLIDVIASLIGIVGFPVHLFFIKKPFSFLKNCFSVFLGSNTWIGYAMNKSSLPSLRPCIIACNGLPKSANQTLPEENLRLTDTWYAKDYEPLSDVKLIVKTYKNLGG